MRTVPPSLPLAAVVALGLSLSSSFARAQSATNPPTAPTAPAAAPGAEPAPPPDAAADPARPPPPGEPGLAPTPLGPPLIKVAIEEPPPMPERTVRRHDGFYARMGVGPLYGHTFVSTDSSTHGDYSAGGGGLAVDLMLGGTPQLGMAVGGALSVQGYGSGDTGTLTLLGAFLDGFPSPADGFHAGGQIGLALATTGRKDNRDEFRGAGLGMSAWLGHGFWVADDFTFGGMLRLSGALLRDGSEANRAGDPLVLSATAYDVALIFNVLYH